NVAAARMQAGDALQHVGEVARPIRFVGKELGKQLDVVQQLGKPLLPRFVGLCFRVNDQPLKSPKSLWILVGMDHGLPPKSKPTSSILVPCSLHGWTVMGG